MSTPKTSSITVAVRVRPFTQTELARVSTSGTKGIRKIVTVVDDRMLVFDPAEGNPLQTLQRNLFPRLNSRAREHRFSFDRLFDEDATQDDVYRGTTQPLLESVLSGYNSTVFAYGATGCGKTHTVSGTPEDPGLVFTTLSELFERIEVLKELKAVDVSLSYLEIYNETIRDLLQPETDPRLLTIREDALHRVCVRNLTQRAVTSAMEAAELVEQGNMVRSVNATQANATSLRAHAVLQISVTQRDRSGGVREEHVMGTLSIIDLAGSERAAATQNSGKRLHEGANINRSLLALGNCINALCDPKKRGHVPYRDLKLTRLLKFSLGGNCKTVMIVCISPSSQHYDETFNALKYADRAKAIKTKVLRNTHNLDRHVGLYLKMITEQKQEIEALRAREERIVQQRVKAVQAQKEQAEERLLAAVEKVRAILEAEDITQQAKYVVRRRILLSQRLELLMLLNLFKDHYGARFADVPQDLTDVKNGLVRVVESLEMEIDQTHTDIGAKADPAIKMNLASLRTLPGWSEYNTVVYEMVTELLKESARKEVLDRADQIWEVVVREKSSAPAPAFSFLAGSFFKLFKKLTFINTSRDVDVIRSDILALTNSMLNDCYEMVSSLNGSGVNELLRMGQKLSPTKRSGRLSPVRKPYRTKKVRWDLASHEKDTEMKRESLMEKELRYEAVPPREDIVISGMNDSHEQENGRRDDEQSEYKHEDKDDTPIEDQSEFERPLAQLEARDSVHMEGEEKLGTFESLRHGDDSDLSRLSLDNSLMIDKENLGFPNPNALLNSEPKYPYGTPQKVAPKGPRSPPRLQIPNNKGAVRVDPIDRFNFETSFSGDIEME